MIASISKMKSFLISSPHISKSTTTPFSLFSSLSSKLFHFKNPNHLLHLKPQIHVPKASLSSDSAHNNKMGSGEIHVIVGPMFAGKTTTLLRKIQSEQGNGRTQVDKVLKGLCYSGRLAEAVGLLCQRGLKVEAETYALLLQECIIWKEYKKGKRIHAQMIVVGFVENEYMKNKLLILYAKSGDLGTAQKVFDRLLEKNLISWNAIISGYVQNRQEDVGMSLYYKMRQSGIIPDQYTFASVFRACACLATLEHGRQAHSVMIKRHIVENVVVNSSLMDMYFKCSDLCDGRRVFDTSKIRNAITWTALIFGYGQHGRVHEVLGFFHRMKSEGFRPNFVTFIGVLSACSHGGLAKEAWEHFSSMTRDYGIRPRGQHYAALVDLLGRAGRLEEAYDFVSNSPCKDHSVMWGAFLWACRIHGNRDMLKLAAKQYFKLESENAGKYVVLSNAYATFGLWDNVAELRSAMKESGMFKEPAYSKLEVQSEVHFFFKGDKYHKQSKEIYEMVELMDYCLKECGYVPSLSWS